MTTSTETTALAVAADVADLLFREARTVNAFAPDDVSEELVHAAYDLTRWGPTAMNTSPLRYVVVRRGAGRERLAAHMAEGNRERVLAAPLTVVLAFDPAFHETMGVLAPHATAVAASLADQEATRVAMARDNAHLQAGYLVVGLRSVGLHVGPMGGMDAAGIDADVLAGTGWRSFLVLNVGLPALEGATRPRAARLGSAEVSRTL
jgi:3-hydroxypropanoate dehydrogenase